MLDVKPENLVTFVVYAILAIAVTAGVAKWLIHLSLQRLADTLKKVDELDKTMQSLIQSIGFLKEKTEEIRNNLTKIESIVYAHEKTIAILEARNANRNNVSNGPR